MYQRYVLGTGATLHLFGEVHRVGTACKPCVYASGCSSITRLVHDMAEAGHRAKQRLDVFVEQTFRKPHVVGTTDRLDMNNAVKRKFCNHAKNTDGNSPCYLTKMRWAIAKTKGPYLRVHSIDMRRHRNDTNEDDHHPMLTNMYEDGKKRSINTVMRTVLMSDRFVDAMGDMGLNLMQRNVTNFDELSVSRVRKQLMKLPAKLRKALIAAVFEFLKKPDPTSTQTRHATMLLMDVGHLARMLYYGGVGGGPAQPAKVLVSYDGAAHTTRMTMMLDYVINKGALDAVSVSPSMPYTHPNYAQRSRNWDKQCLTIQMPQNYGFT